MQPGTRTGTLRFAFHWKIKEKFRLGLPIKSDLRVKCLFDGMAEVETFLQKAHLHLRILLGFRYNVEMEIAEERRRFAAGRDSIHD
jgi:hypothetical protein